MRYTNFPNHDTTRRQNEKYLIHKKAQQNQQVLKALYIVQNPERYRVIQLLVLKRTRQKHMQMSHLVSWPLFKKLLNNAFFCPLYETTFATLLLITLTWSGTLFGKLHVFCMLAVNFRPPTEVQVENFCPSRPQQSSWSYYPSLHTHLSEPRDNSFVVGSFIPRKGRMSHRRRYKEAT